MTSIRPSMMRLAGKKHHLVTVRRNIRLTITYYHPTYSFSPGVMRLGNAKRHLPTVKRNIRLTITYCRPMPSISPSMMRLIDKKCHLAIARGNIWPAITYCLSMFSLSYFMMRLLESNNINVECRQLLLFPTSYLWRVDGSASVFSSQPHPSLSLFTFTFHFFLLSFISTCWSQTTWRGGRLHRKLVKYMFQNLSMWGSFVQCNRKDTSRELWITLFVLELKYM